MSDQHLERLATELESQVQGAATINAGGREPPVIVDTRRPVGDVEGALLARVRELEATVRQLRETETRLLVELESAEKRVSQAETHKDFYLRAATELRTRLADARRVLDDPTEPGERLG